ncbi:hypothetical protein MSG28_015964 [Choristoneura fumiferana]|uniref:Uncharacterized protein n=1 Tax=Choristoneura fumiferana TaxID=7141 RepID=A0ACC0K4X9_CHOFU|nr:hypothetical protein MSG28_015964 [Choristoneura fumiferana]
MALYTILFGLSIFMIALVVAIIKKMFFHWKEEHKIERMTLQNREEHPTVSLIIYSDKCVIRSREYAQNLKVYDVMSKSDTSLTKHDNDSLENMETVQNTEGTELMQETDIIKDPNK